MAGLRRRVLIVTSSYAPAMIADMHRARQLAWELPGLGWDVEILTPDEGFQQTTCLDRDSAGYFAPATKIASVAPFLPRLFQVLGLGSIGWRAFWPMKRMGDRLLSGRRFDLVYFSTTQFSLFLLGPGWQRRHRIPFVLDLHDPCYREESTPPVWARRSSKHELSRRLTRLIESRAVARTAGLVAVSQEYIETMRRRYGSLRPLWASPGRSATIPFAVLPRDLEESGGGRASEERPPGEVIRLVYVGAGGPIMQRAFGVFCRTLAHLRISEPLTAERLRVELYGTMLGWREGDRLHFGEIAEAHGVGDLVFENPRRVSYRRSLELLLGAGGALILGVDDAGYMPSKLFTYAYSGKPLLAMVRRDGPAYSAMNAETPLGNTLWFEPGREIPLNEGSDELRRFLGAAARGEFVDRQQVLEPNLASNMARRHRDLFEAVCNGSPAA